MTKTKKIIRYILTVFILIMVFIETGIFTGIALTLISIRFENIVNYIREGK